MGWGTEPRSTTIALDTEASDFASQPTAYITVIEGAAPQTVELPLRHGVSIGRSRSGGMTLDSPSVSRLHATVRWDGGASLRVTDHGSRNGTYVDDQRVTGTVRVHSGASLRIGKVDLVVAIVGVHQRPTTPPGDPFAHASPAMKAALEVADKLAQTDTTALIVGETGVGKELLARHIHDKSARAAEPFMAVNCGAIPETLAPSILFGHEKGAFSGATARRPGIFEAAQRGTVFLDEVGELSLPLQATLLRVLQEREVLRVGGTEPVAVHARVLGATHQDLDAMVQEGNFRQDLLYRLDVIRVTVPPLRERADEIPKLAERFLGEHAEGRRLELTDEATEALLAHSWPGNIRELRNTMERAAAIAEGTKIGPAQLGLKEAQDKQALRNRLDGAEREAIEQALAASDGNQTRAARLLGISRRSLIYRMERVGLKRPPPHRR